MALILIVVHGQGARGGGGGSRGGGSSSRYRSNPVISKLSFCFDSFRF